MKYWRGYLMAAIVAACTYGLEEFAKAHSALVDMIYPYATRMAQTFLADWSGTVDFCLWQVLLVAFGVLVLCSGVLMVVLKWNPIQWFGWVLAVVSVFVLLNTGIYGLNRYAGPITQDIRLEEADYTLEELVEATKFYGKQADQFAATLGRDGRKQVQLPSFQTLNQQAENGFTYMKTQQYQSIFAGSTVPVKQLDWEKFFTARNVDGLLVGLTGEAAVNPQIPSAAMPFVICRLMAQRMCIANTPDANLAAFLAGRSNEQVHYQYSAYLSAYYHGIQFLKQVEQSTGKSYVNRVTEGVSQQLLGDVADLEDFYGEQGTQNNETFCKYLVSLYIQEEILPQLREEEVLFNPLDKSQVDLSGIINAGA